MDEVLVVNTGPMITLSKMGVLHLLDNLPYRFLTTPEVVAELRAGLHLGHPPEIPGALDVVSLKTPLRRQDVATLGDGEASVIQLAQELDVRRVCIDEVKGRRVARAAGLDVLGVLGLLGRAKALGLVAEVKPLLEKAVADGIRYDTRLLQHVLEALGEA